MKESAIYSLKKKSSLRKRKDEESLQEDNEEYHDNDTSVLSKSSKPLIAVSSRKEKICLITDIEQSQESVNTIDIHDNSQEEHNDTFINTLKVSCGQSIYRGQKGYKTFHESTESKKFKPNQSRIKAQQNTKNSIRFDYQPHVCKDYKETGYCGFGDSCVFLHDRGDYKMGWELDREWESKQGDLDIDPNKYLISNDSNQEKYVDNFPSICSLCQNEFHQPVETKCLHYFCEKCALSHYKKTPKCFICQALTYGQFKPAKYLIQKLSDKLAHLEEERKDLERDLEQQISTNDN